jgi:flavin-binding protein dodecin
MKMSLKNRTAMIVSHAWLAGMILLGGCATQPRYAPAEEPGEPGYWQTRLTENRYRVSFVGTPGTSSETVKNYALLRAAELTLDAGYNWFRIVERETEQSGRDRQPRVTLGVGAGCPPFGCRIVGSRWYTGVGLDSVYRGGHYRTSMEIAMGRGQPEDHNAAYDAGELARHLRENEKAFD